MDREDRSVVVHVKILDVFLSSFPRVLVSLCSPRPYIYRNRPRVKPVLRLEDRERIEHLIPGARGFSSKMVHTDHASLYFSQPLLPLRARARRSAPLLSPRLWIV